MKARLGNRVAQEAPEQPKSRDSDRDVELAAIELTPLDYIDPSWRLIVQIDDEEPEHLRADPEGLLAWYRAHYPRSIIGEHDARFEVWRGSRQLFTTT